MTGIHLLTGDLSYVAEDGGTMVVLNGQVYDFPALRQGLQGAGRQFRSRADGEVILHGYQARGDALLERLDGMFASVLCDQDRRRLLLPPDGVGKKPLYSLAEGGRFLFGSEAKALLGAPGVCSGCFPGSFREHLQQGSVVPPDLSRHIRMLPPAMRLAVTRDGVQVPVRYWRL